MTLFESRKVDDRGAPPSCGVVDGPCGFEDARPRRLGCRAEHEGVIVKPSDALHPLGDASAVREPQKR